MMKQKWKWIGIFVVIFTFLATSASAQTSMQRKAAEERGEEPSESVEESVEEVEERAQREEEPQRREEQVEPVEEPDDDRVFHFFRSHKPGLRIDAGFGEGHESAMWGLGLGYLYAIGWEIRPIEEVQAVLRFGIGPDFLALLDGDGLHALAAFMMGRGMAISTSTGGIGVEFGLGAGAGRGGAGPAGRAGLYWSGRYAEIGYFYQFDLISRPAWMRPHNLGIRFHIPIWTH